MTGFVFFETRTGSKTHVAYWVDGRGWVGGCTARNGLPVIDLRRPLCQTCEEQTRQTTPEETTAERGPR